MCEEWAAAYVGQLSVSIFRTEVAAGRIPAAIWVTPGRKAWLKEDLDRYIDVKSGKSFDDPHEPSLDDLAAEWDRALDGERAARLS